MTGLAGLAAFAYSNQIAKQLVIDGKVSSIRFTQEGGQYMVPLSDIATAFGYTMSIVGDQATLVRISKPVGDSMMTAQDASNRDYSAATTTSYSNSSSRLGDATSGIGSVPLPAQISVKLGEAASVEGVDYTVTSIDEVGSKYKDVYDQRQTTLQSKWKTDSLVVLKIKETNQGTIPMTAQFPSVGDVTVFDDNKMGYGATGLDLGQLSGVVTTGALDYVNSYADTVSVTNPILGPGGTIHFAVVASLPKGDRVTSVVIRVPGTSTGSHAGTVITILRP